MGDYRKRELPKNAYTAMARAAAGNMAIATFISIGITYATWFYKNINFMMPMFVLNEVNLFTTVSQVFNAVMWTVDLKDRTFANSATIFSIHVFGDSLSPYLLGHLRDRFKGRECRIQPLHSADTKFCPSGWTPAFAIISLPLV